LIILLASPRPDLSASSSLRFIRLLLSPSYRRLLLPPPTSSFFFLHLLLPPPAIDISTGTSSSFNMNIWSGISPLFGVAKKLG
jgi:hypothetical protein